MITRVSSAGRSRGCGLSAPPRRMSSWWMTNSSRSSDSPAQLIGDHRGTVGEPADQCLETGFGSGAGHEPAKMLLLAGCPVADLVDDIGEWLVLALDQVGEQVPGGPS